MSCSILLLVCAGLLVFLCCAVVLFIPLATGKDEPRND